jgi:hypothetical protein
LLVFINSPAAFSELVTTHVFKLFGSVQQQADKQAGRAWRLALGQVITRHDAQERAFDSGVHIWRRASMADLSISVESPIHAGPLGAATAIPVAGPAKAKVDELFCRWLAMPDTASLVNGWIEELQAGKTIVPPKATHTSLRTPTSRSAPVSPSRSAATGYTPPLSPSRFGTRQSPVQQRFGFGETVVIIAQSGFAATAPLPLFTPVLRMNGRFGTRNSRQGDWSILSHRSTARSARS